MKSEKKETVEVTITHDLCDVCKEQVIEAKGLPENDPSYSLMGVVNGDRAYHWRCLESELK